MKTLRTAALTIAALGITAASAQATTHSFPALEPTQAIVTGFHTFPTPGMNPVAALNNGYGEGIEGGLNQVYALSHYTIPPGDKVLSATVKACGSAGTETENGRWEAMIVGAPGLYHANVGLEGPGTGCISGTWTLPPGNTESWCFQSCYGEFGEQLTRTRQEQIDEMMVALKTTKYSRHNRVEYLEVQLEVEGP